MQLKNYLGEQFEIRILGNQFDDSKKQIKWWLRSSIIITENGKIHKTKLKFLTQEDLFLLIKWLKDVYSGNYEKTVFQFVDGHVWFRLWRKGNKRFLRFFIQGDYYRKFRWDWRISKDNNDLLRYIEILYLSSTNKNPCAF
jgi:hypothetical protein